MNEFHCAKEHDLGGLPSTTPSTKTSKTSWKPYTDNKCVFVFFIILLTYFDSKASTETYSKSRYRQRHRGLPSVFCSPKAVSKGGPNKPVVSSETGVCWLLRQKKQDNTEETVSSKQLQLQQSVHRLVACRLIRLQLPFPLKSSQQYYKCVILKVWQEHKQRQEEWREKLMGWFWGQNKNNWLLPFVFWHYRKRKWLWLNRICRKYKYLIFTVPRLQPTHQTPQPNNNQQTHT